MLFRQLIFFSIGDVDKLDCSNMDHTKEIIINKAFKLFLYNSYEAVSISDISKSMGFSKGALYYHFKNKEELFTSVIDKSLLLPEINVDTDKISLFDLIKESNINFERFIKNLFSTAETFSAIRYLAFFANAFRHCRSCGEETCRFIENEIEKKRIVILNAIKSGEIRDDIDPTIIATNFSYLDFGIIGNIAMQRPLDESIELLRKETAELYKLLKK